MKPIRMLLFQNEKIFGQFFCAFPDLHQASNTLKKAMSLAGYLFLKL